MVYEIGEKVHIVERRNFPEDLRRHFVGEIVKCSDHALRVVGYAWVFNRVKAEFLRKAEKRERIIALGEKLTINIIPKDVDISEIKYQTDPKKGLVVTDGEKFFLEISEFSANR
jgi:hypothetical protein